MTITFSVTDWLKKYEHKLNITSVEKLLLRDFINGNLHPRPATISFTEKVDMKAKRNSLLYCNVEAATDLAVSVHSFDSTIQKTIVLCTDTCTRSQFVIIEQIREIPADNACVPLIVTL